ncbi:MAG: FAD-dependent oxidoreductase [Planctomycetaceae bacterium]
MQFPPVLIIGGGVSGVTCGIVLQLLGIPTRIVCRHWLGERGTSRCDPRFASMYPAASIIPHTVNIADEVWHMRCAQTFFGLLADTGIPGLRRQRHFEVFESPRRMPAYAAEMPEFSIIQPDEQSDLVLRRCHDRPVFGWSFKTLFAEMPAYRSFLASMYVRVGGSIHSAAVITSESLRQFSEETVLNCSGAWSHLLFQDSQESRFVKGILLRADLGGSLPVHRHTGELTSYNYHPDPSVYAQPDGTSADVYFYPRTDACLLGGARLQSPPLTADDVGAVGPEGEKPWMGDEYSKETIMIPSADAPGTFHAVPRPILDLNAQLIFQLTGVNVRDYPLSGMVGYRHQRQQVRIESQTIDSRRVIHNYGHGGAGVTLSWSCAIKVAQMVATSMGLEEITDAVSGRLKAHIAGGIGSL